MSDTPDIKPRSRDVTDGLEKTAARGMLRAVDLRGKNLRQRAKALIGIAAPQHREALERAARERFVKMPE